MEENIEKRVDLTLFSEKIQELKDQIARGYGSVEADAYNECACSYSGR